MSVKKFITTNFFAIVVVTAFAIAHAPGITSALLDEHSWRQTDTAAVARNFQYESPNLFQPRVDIRGQYSGITGMEFPVYNYSLFIFNVIFGYQHWHGRILTLTFSCLALWYFYSFIRARYNKTLANFSLGVLACAPLFFLFAKNVQPDMLMIMFMMMSLYFAQKYTVKLENRYFYFMLVTLSLTLLTKIPAVFVIIPMAGILKTKEIRSMIDARKVIAFFLIIIVPVLCWYLYSDYLSSHFGMGDYFYGDVSIIKSLNLALSKGFWRVVTEYTVPTRFPVGVMYFIVVLGILVAFARKNFLPILWLLSFIFFLGLFAIKSFYHNYYALPLIPPIALLSGIAFEWIYSKLSKESKAIATFFVIGLVLFASLLIYKRVQTLYSPQVKREYLQLEEISSKKISNSDLIITNGNISPIMLYYSNRKGWSFPESLFDSSTISEYRKLGADKLLINKDLMSSNNIENLKQRYLNIYEDANFVVFQI